MPPPTDRPLSHRASARTESSDLEQPRPGHFVLDRVRRELGIAGEDGSSSAAPAVPLHSRLATGELAWASVGAVALSVGHSPAFLDPERIATAYRSDRFLTINGAAPRVWSPFSGFWRTSDGWVRTHGNYPHHAAGLRWALHLRDDADADAVRDTLAAQTTAASVSSISAAGGLAVPVAPENPAADRLLRERPLLAICRIDVPSSSRSRPATAPASHHVALPLHDIRVLDLTRVIAGPVCSRTLALLGADVLRVDPPHLPEPQWQHLDTGHGKRSALLDAHSSRLQELLADADVVVLGYRPAALERLGLTPVELVSRYPGLIVAQLSAWGREHPDRAGFDSLVQAASGISLIESPDGETPGVLPAQALDHSAGYLLAAAVTALLGRRSREGGSWYVNTSLRRVAAELLGMPRRREPGAEVVFDTGAHLARFDVDGSALVTARPALPGYEFDAPHAWASDQPVW